MPNRVGHPRVVQEFQAYLFQHFDSRGGSVLAVGFPDEPSATFAYGAKFYECQDSESTAALVADDYEGLVRVLVYEQPIPQDWEGELLTQYSHEHVGITELYEGLLYWQDDVKQVWLIPRPRAYAACQHGSSAKWFERQGIVVNEDHCSELGEDAMGCWLIRPFRTDMVERKAWVSNLNPLWVTADNGRHYRVDVTIQQPLAIGQVVNIVTGRSQTTVDGRYCEILSVVKGEPK